MLHTLEIIVALGVFMPVSLAGAEKRCDPKDKSVREVRQVALGIIAADNARNVERVLSYYAADAILLPPGEPPVVGRDAIKPRYLDLFSRYQPQIEAHINEACVSGTFAFVRGHNGGRLVSREGGSDRQLNDEYLMLLHLEPRFGWRITHLMWHPAGA